MIPNVYRNFIWVTIISQVQLQTEPLVVDFISQDLELFTNYLRFLFVLRRL